MSGASQRLVEVWASESCASSGACGSGWVLGEAAVLTAAHVVNGASLVLVRLAGVAAGGWVNAEERWRHPTLDVAVLAIIPGAEQRWNPPSGPSRRLAAVGERTVSAEAIGFPDATERPDRVRRPDIAKGTLMPGGGVRDTDRLMAFDVVDGTVPDDALLWRGFSGAAVRDEHDRLVAVVAQAAPDRKQGRLFVVFLADAALDEGFVSVAEALAFDGVVEDRDAPLWRASVTPESLRQSGVPICLADVRDLRTLGVRAVAAGSVREAVFGPYVERDADGAIGDALNEAAAGGRRFVLILGDSASGKSRSLAEIAIHHDGFRDRLLVVPQIDGLRRLLDEHADLNHAVVWLDDLDKQLSTLQHDVMRRVLSEFTDVMVLATMRRSQLQDRQEGLSDPWWRFLTDETAVHRVALDAELTGAEIGEAQEKYANGAMVSALENGIGLGEYFVRGPELRERFKLLTGPRAHFANTVLAWSRTGIGIPIPEPEAKALWIETMMEPHANRFSRLHPSAQEDLFRQSAKNVCEPLISRDWVNIALVHERPEGYEPDDFVVDLVSKDPDTRASRLRSGSQCSL